MKRYILLIMLTFLLSGFSSRPSSENVVKPSINGSTSLSSVDVFVNGMTCSLCAQGIEEKLSEYPTVQTMTVDFESKIVTITFLPKSPLTEKQIHEAISYAGYEVISISY